MKDNEKRSNSEYVKRPRHARVSFQSASCVDCRRALPVTHPVHLYGDRCHLCSTSYSQSALVQMGVH